MRMSKKHYEAVAKILSTSDTVAEVARRLGLYFGAQSARFDADRFALACARQQEPSKRRAWFVMAVCRRLGPVDSSSGKSFWEYYDKVFEVRAGSKEGAAEQAHHYAAEQGLVIAGIRNTEEKS